ncbi:MAG: carbohydrate ABC transporter substrate-binding protein [Actinobacteria bacterium]|nr:carbohydrate ABC transporter substrate-binding protein [Actinomycetota bacterium]
MQRRWYRWLGLLMSSVLLLSACAGGEVGGDGGGGGATEEGGGGEVSVAAVWTGTEQENFEAVLDAFTEASGVETSYQSSEDLGTFLGTQIEGGSPPDVAMIPQPGLVADLAADGSLVELEDEAAGNLEANFAPIWTELGSVDDTLYGVYFKVASKATWWYNTASFDQAGVQPPQTWDEMLKTAETVNASGVPWLSIGGADAWPLTDIFENVYLQTAGPEKYDQLASHEIPWTDPSVAEALEVLAELFQDDANLVGGRKGALQDDFVTSVTQVFEDPPAAATVYEGDFVAGVISGETNAKVGSEADFFDFPVIEGEGAVVGGGDVGVALTDNPDAQALLAFLATPEAAEVWASKGGFISPNEKLDMSVYPDEISSRIAEGVVAAAGNGSFRFDMSDLQPAEFGATAGRGMWVRMQDFLKNPDDISGVTKALESDAKKAFK